MAIAAAAFFVYAYRVPPVSGLASLQAAPVLCAVVAGACVGFLPWNFHPARIIMGDTGSMLLGMLMAAATISAIGRTLQPTGHDVAAFSIPLLIPVLVLAVPLLDVALAILRRLRHRRPVFAPDKAHIHHQLQEVGHSHRQTVLLMYLWSAVLAGSALGLTYVSSSRVAAATVAFAVLVVIGHPGPAHLARRARRPGPRGPPPGPVSRIGRADRHPHAEPAEGAFPQVAILTPPMPGEPDGGDESGDSGIAWSIIGTLVAGVLVWGGVGWLVDRWLGTDSVFLAIGLVVGFAASMYLVIVRYGRNQRT